MTGIMQLADDAPRMVVDLSYLKDPNWWGRSEPQSQPRAEWPIDTATLIDHHRGCAAMAIRWAGDHAKKAIALAGEVQ